MCSIRLSIRLNTGSCEKHMLINTDISKLQAGRDQLSALLPFKITFHILISPKKQATPQEDNHFDEEVWTDRPRGLQVYT